VSEGFFDAAEGRIATPSSEVNSIKIGWSVEITEKSYLFLETGKTFEIMQKALSAGIPIVSSISAPQLWP